LKRSLFAELKRRNVFRAAVAYLALGWVVTQVTATVAPALHLPDWIVSVVVWIGVIGFPFLLVFSWVYELTPEGLKRESEVDRSASITHVTGRRLDYIIIGLLVLAIGCSVFAYFGPRRGGSTGSSEAAAPAAVSAGTTASSAVPTATSITIATSDNSIAVLPFVNMSSDREQEFFSDGITEELLNLLAKIPQLDVTARTSSFSFKGKDVGIKEIAKTLGVTHVLEGSVRKSGDQVRITAQLINAVKDKHLWSETYDRKLDDIFKVQDEIAGKVVEELKVTLLGAAPKAKPVDPKVYALILQAEALSDQASKASREQGESVSKQALVIAPSEARAWAGLSRVYINQAIFGDRPAAEGARLSREAANKAISIDPNNVIAIGVLGRVASDFDFDLPAAARYFQHALELEPGNLVPVNAAGILLMNTGRIDEAIRLLEYRVAHDPANPTAYCNLGNALYVARQWDASIDAFRSAVRLSPEYVGARQSVGAALMLGKHDAAGALKECEAEPDEAQRMYGIALALHALGRTKEADAALQALVDKYGKDQPEEVAGVYGYRHEADAAFKWLDTAAAVHDPGAASVLTDPLLDSLHQDTRWLPYLRKIGYAPEQLAKIDFKVMLPKEWQAETTADNAAKPAATSH
jgi:TolB-like protein/tetratricopeptide (TPR) repeat protein